MKPWGVLLVGAGIGGVVGAQSGASVTWAAGVVLVVGLVLLALGGRAGGRDLVADAQDRPPRNDRPPKNDALHLGKRVDGILALAEEQAADHVNEAKATAERIVAEARAEAARLRGEPH